MTARQREVAAKARAELQDYSPEAPIPALKLADKANEETDPVWEFAHHLQKCKTCRECDPDPYECDCSCLCTKGQDLRKKLEAVLDEEPPCPS